MTDYQDIKLVEANRLHSVQYNGGNNQSTAEWTNKVGSGINLQAGDTYEVHSSYISERGAESETIEFKGEFIERKNFIETQITPSDFNGSLSNGLRTINQYNLEEASNVSVPRDLFDNKATISISYYINCMGEYSVMLPRRHILKCGPEGEDSDPNSDINFSLVYNSGLIDSISNGLPSTRLTSFFIPDYRIDNGQIAYIKTLTDKTPCYKLKMDNSRYTLFVKKKTYFNGDFTSSKYALSPIVIEAIPANGTTAILSDPSNDIDKSIHFSIYFIINSITYVILTTAFDSTTFNTTVTFSPPIVGGLAIDTALNDFYFGASVSGTEIESVPNFLGPAGFEYIPFKQLIDIELPDGKNSATDISNIITDTLSTVQKNETFKYSVGEDEQTPGESDVTNYIETNCMKAFNCGNMQCHNKDHYDAYIQQGYSPETLQKAVRYISNFQFVAYKRPEIQETGRLLNNNMWYEASRINQVSALAQWEGTNCVRDQVTVKGKLYGLIILQGLVWRKKNLQIFSNFLKSQALYPELFNLDNIQTDDKPQYNTASFSVDTARFIHVNNHNNTNYDWLGYDGMKQNATPAVENGNGNTVVTEKACPFWFQYKKEHENFFDEDNAIDRTFYNQFDGIPTFGCLYKVGNGNAFNDDRDFSAAILYDYYGFTNNIDNGTSNIWGNGLANHRQGGFDQCFQAWGTAAILPFNGYPNYFPSNITGINGLPNVTSGNISGVPIPSFSTKVALANSSYKSTNNSSGTLVSGNLNPTNADLFLSSYIINKVYIGANKPSFIYDSLQNRFKFTLLNTPNRTQQQFNTGVISNGSNKGPEDQGSEAFADVIKYNPSDLLQNFTPDKMPYQMQIRKWTSQVSGNYQGFFSTLNPAIEPFRAYDSFCGISIDDFGYSETPNNNNMWNILGFDNSQLHNVKTSDNVISNLVVDANNINSLSQIVTNADFQSVSEPQKSVNFVGVPLGGQQLPTRYFVSQYVANKTDQFVDAPMTTPPISIENVSVAFTAKNLPITILRPYYLVKSSLNEGSNYLGQANSGIPSNIVGVIPKTNEAGDYYQKSGGFDVFTITRPMTITNITTSIHDPDGSLAHVNDGSSVIYKFTKQRSILTIDDIVEDAEQNQKSNKKKK